MDQLYTSSWLVVGVLIRSPYSMSDDGPAADDFLNPESSDKKLNVTARPFLTFS